MARRVYSGHQIFKKLEDQKAEVKDVWATLTVEHLKQLYSSISRRILAVIDSKRRRH